jgi:L-threonylcarbamoyladenylate synthase
MDWRARYSGMAMTPPQTRVLPFDNEGIAQAARLILDGEVVALPTETVYGLAADATNPDAIARIYEAKDRPRFNPLIVHVPHFGIAERLGHFGNEARALASQHWPGPLTLVVPRRKTAPVASLLTAGLDTLAIRVPAHPAIQTLLHAVGRPLAAPSANASGAISPTRAEHVLRSLGGRIPLVLDAGPSECGLESTIVAATGGPLRLLRRGPLQIDAAIEAELGAIEAPGQMARHYAPSKPIRLNVTDAERRPDEYLIGFAAVEGDANLSRSGDVREAAARLFDLLHQADASDMPRIAVAPVFDRGLGTAINDRLRRAASPL